MNSSGIKFPFHHLIRMSFALLVVAQLLFPVQSAASTVPRVVTDIPPTHSLVSMVMGDLGAPELLMSGSVSPHDYALRPSDALALTRADLVFWMHPELTHWLDSGLASLAPSTTSTILMQLADVIVLPAREQADFLAELKNGHGSQNSGHVHTIDPHGWLDPVNALIWLPAIAETLIQKDAANASVYRQNAANAQREIEQSLEELRVQLLAIKMNPFLTLHDSMQYFEKRFSLTAVGAVSNTDAVQAGPRRLRRIRSLLKESDAQCVFAEAQENNTILATVTEGLDVKFGELNPVGVGLPVGAQLYQALLNQLAGSLLDCLSG